MAIGTNPASKRSGFVYLGEKIVKRGGSGFTHKVKIPKEFALDRNQEDELTGINWI
jgi:hypothetical protein